MAIPETVAGASTGYRSLAVILVVGAVLRLVLWCWFAGKPIQIRDEEHYNTLAINLVERGEFALDAGVPTSMRPPLYPMLLAAMYRVFGVENFQAMRLLQAGLSLMTAWVLFRIGCETFSHRTGVWLSGLYSFYPSLLAYNNLVLGEVMFTLFLCLACLNLTLFWKRDRMWYAVAAGCMFGLGALTRSVLWLWPPVLCLFILLFGKVPFSRRLLTCAALCGAFALTLSPWSIRTSRLEKTFIAVDTMGGRNLMMGNYEFTPLYRSWDAISIEGEQSWYSILAAEYPEYYGTTQGQRDKLAARAGLSFMKQNPGLTLKRDLVKLIQFWGLERELIAGAARGFWGEGSAAATLLLTTGVCSAYAAAVILGAFGMVLVPPKDWRIHGSLLLLIAFVCGMHTLVFAHSRYHLPLIPLVLAYSANAIVNARAIWLERGTRYFWLACSLSMLFVGGWVWEITVVEGDRFLQMLRSFTHA
jgi:4-amino-4-deoxy-L-arabinose transferase-like glycosyltransferase